MLSPAVKRPASLCSLLSCKPNCRCWNREGRPDSFPIFVFPTSSRHPRLTFILPPTCFCFYYLTSQLRYSSSTIKAVSFITPSQDSPPSSSPSSSSGKRLALISLSDKKELAFLGNGLPNWLESMRIAMKKAGEEVRGAALASDTFFPFAWNDAVEEVCQSGVSIIAEPGPSIRDEDAVACCDKYGVSLLFTNVRHFRH